MPAGGGGCRGGRGDLALSRRPQRGTAGAGPVIRQWVQFVTACSARGTAHETMHENEDRRGVAPVWNASRGFTLRSA